MSECDARKKEGSTLIWHEAKSDAKTGDPVTDGIKNVRRRSIDRQILYGESKSEEWYKERLDEDLNALAAQE